MLRKVFLAIGGRWLGSELQAMAKGERGNFLKSAYWWLVGKKTPLGLLLGGMSVAFVSAGQDQAAGYVATIAGVLVSVGLIDKAWRSRPNWEEEHVWLLVRSHGTDILAVLGALTAALTTCSPATERYAAHLHLSCSSAVAIIAAASTIFTWLFAEAKTATAPAAIAISR